jgi:hypothetical protein
LGVLGVFRMMTLSAKAGTVVVGYSDKLFFVLI